MLSHEQVGFQCEECLGMETINWESIIIIMCLLLSGEGSPRQSFINGLLRGFKIGSGDYLLPWLQSNCLYLGL